MNDSYIKKDKAREYLNSTIRNRDKVINSLQTTIKELGGKKIDSGFVKVDSDPSTAHSPDSQAYNSYLNIDTIPTNGSPIRKGKKTRIVSDLTLNATFQYEQALVEGTTSDKHMHKIKSTMNLHKKPFQRPDSILSTVKASNFSEDLHFNTNKQLLQMREKMVNFVSSYQKALVKLQSKVNILEEENKVLSKGKSFEKVDPS